MARLTKVTTGEKTYQSSQEREARQKLYQLFLENPLPEDQIMPNLGLFLNSKTLSRILFLNFIYQKIIDIHGVIFDFGTRWGQNMSVFAALRGIYEPFNRHRKIVGFDTFSGFPSVSIKDGIWNKLGAGSVTVTKDYEKYLIKIMESQENDNPLSHIKKFDIRKGDAVFEIEKYLKENPETIVALAYFDFDIYKPTKKCLLAIKDRLVKGSILCFDELNDPDSPGETIALMETLGLNNIRLQRYRYTSRISFFEWE